MFIFAVPMILQRYIKTRTFYGWTSMFLAVVLLFNQAIVPFLHQHGEEHVNDRNTQEQTLQLAADDHCAVCTLDLYLELFFQEAVVFHCFNCTTRHPSVPSIARGLERPSAPCGRAPPVFRI